MGAVRQSFVKRALAGVAFKPDADVVLRDCSLAPRTGFKAADTPAWLQSQGVALPEAPNRATVQADGAVVARLSASEFLILGGPLVARLDAAWSLDVAELCMQVPRRDSHAWFYLSGPRLPEMFAKICGVDLRPKAFADGAVAQTTVARLSAIVIRQSEGFHLLADSAAALYLWDSLLDAMAEFNGGIAAPEVPTIS